MLKSLSKDKEFIEDHIKNNLHKLLIKLRSVITLCWGSITKTSLLSIVLWLIDFITWTIYEPCSVRSSSTEYKLMNCCFFLTMWKTLNILINDEILNAWATWTYLTLKIFIIPHYMVVVFFGAKIWLVLWF